MNICTTTPPRNRISSCNVSQVLEKSLAVNHKNREWKNCCFWGTINLTFLIVLFYDVSYACPFYIGYYYYTECALIVILTGNVLYYIAKILKIAIIRSEPIPITLQQKKLLKIADSDPNFKIVESPIKTAPTTPLTVSTPMNLSASSWLSSSQNNSMNNYTLSSSWTYSKGQQNSPNFSQKPSPVTKFVPFQDTTSVETITDETSLEKYLKEYSSAEHIHKSVHKSEESSNLLSSFWRNPNTKPAKDTPSFLNGQYHLSLPVQGPSKSKEDTSLSPGQMSALEVWTRINVDSIALTQWNENLRKWISQTILERLVAEFERINSSLEKHGLSDVKIGCVGLERLRKTAHIVPVAQDIPSLTALLPFLEITTNQEYLVSRIRDLAKGGCMSEFKWNGGRSYNGKEWDESLPTDCAIVMHLFASYLDTQLMPLPNMPDTKPFSGHHFIKATDKMPTLTPHSIFIHEVRQKPPHYRVIVGEKVYEMVKGYNNLFHSILFFIYQVNELEQGMLGRVNLGRAGLNILWVIDRTD